MVGVGYVGHGLTRLSESNSSVDCGLSFISLTLHSNGVPPVANVSLNEVQLLTVFITHLDSDSTSCCGDTTCINTVPDFPTAQPMQYPVSRNVLLGGIANTSDVTDVAVVVASIKTFGRLLAALFFVIALLGVHCTCSSSKLPLGIRLSVNSPKSCEADVLRVLEYLTADQVLLPPLVVETVDFRILMSNLVPFGRESSPV